MVKPGADYGSMGLKGLWFQLGNSSAILVSYVLLFVAVSMMKNMHHEGMDTLKAIIVQQREDNQAAHVGFAQQADNMRSSIDKLARVLERAQCTCERKQ